jgi:prevent-host-death family protein
MVSVGMQEAKASFSKLIAAVETGEEVVLERYGKAVARLIPFEQTEGPPDETRD